MNLPKISIITPSYNQAQFLEATILSVLGQNYPNLEYIIMDGGSTDTSSEIIKKYENKLAYWQSKKDRGQADAINQGFEKATGDILMWLNSDDLLMPDVLNFIAEKYSEDSTKLYYGNCIHFRNDDSVMSWGSDVVKKTVDNKLNELDYIIQPSSFWPKTIWEQVGKLNEEIHFGFDWEWFLRVQQKFELQPIAKCISMYRIHDNHKSGTGGDKRQIELLKIYKSYNPELSELYKLLINENLDEVRNFSTLKFKIKEKIGRHTSFFQKLKTKNSSYKKFTNKQIEQLLTML
ncbi:glycosyltransferase family 2 protein [Chryseobacterium luquanense]|uniref:Glycosyltransferase n=1 Tax=Chryseobacterium luquanense TaxID=2983766 RepID=A0ABT3Y658_9FLAO|nr:glycosyltransferase family 2 protein [Chryseobacterium luquanense]MCX8533634.1 glycosyltransferase [Chryseobacterium luquanense]